MRGESDLPSEDLANVDFLAKRYTSEVLEGGAAGVTTAAGRGGGARGDDGDTAGPLPFWREGEGEEYRARAGGGLVSRDMEREAERRAWEEEERRAAAAEREERDKREQRRELVAAVAAETAAGRAKAEQERKGREAAGGAERERLKQAFIQKQLEKMRKKGGV
jgi:flagellar biosynthesis GTPase FlhF